MKSQMDIQRFFMPTQYFLTVICAVVFITQLCSQNGVETMDSVSVEFKAKLLTLTRLGVSKKDMVLENILSQKIHYLDTGCDQLIAMRIPFNQKYFLNNGASHSPLWGDCDYVILYYKRNHQFYRVRGFGEGDIIAFAADLDDLDSVTIISHQLFLNSHSVNDQRIDLIQLLDYAKLSRKKRRRKKFDFIYDCEEEVSNIVITNSKDTNQ